MAAAEPLGFPNCPRCELLKGGTALVCTKCARETVPRVPGPVCAVCSQTLAAEGARCRNQLCNQERSIDRILAISTYSNPLGERIKQLKYGHFYGWATIFGRIVVGTLERNRRFFGDVGLIIPNPTFSGRSSIARHTELVVDAAYLEDVHEAWPLVHSDDPVLVKTAETTRSATPGAGAASKRSAAMEHVGAVHVVDPGRVDGQFVLVYDDICTTGHQLDQIARLLKAHGAVRVEALVLARTTWW